MNINADIDIDGAKYSINIVTTIQRPDLVLVDNFTNPSSVILFELTQSCRKWSDVPEANSVVLYSSYSFLTVIN